MSNERKTWTSRIGFVLASAGAAVGLGAIWKFPYLAGTNGGSVFLFPYILLTFTVGLALLIAEIALGRLGRGGIVTTYRRIAGNKLVLIPMGYLGVLTGFLVLSFYSAIGGWTIAYLFEAIGGEGLIADQSQLGAHFGAFTADPVLSVGFQWLFLLLNGLIVALDITKGIERLSKVLMPLLFVLMCVVIVRGLMLPGAWGGVEFLFKFDFESFTFMGLLQAMGFTFFSLCVGCGCMMTYGSYLDDKSNLLRSCSWIAFLAVIASLMGGLMVMPPVFAFGLDPTAGPGLTFITMPAIFAQLPFGQIFAVIFYICLLVAAITSSVSMIEILVAYLVDERGMSRPKASVISTIALAIVGVLPCLSFGALSDVTFFGGKTFFDIFDFFTSNLALPIGGLLILYLAGRTCWPEISRNLAGGEPVSEGTLKALRFTTLVLAPILVLAVLISGLV
ncbi:sodium-dependent transporter [Sutterella sp.]|uniref:sodium-dependent transporter n=1 Tax=Sutterella sp. TaxID=1981025 RepID=UPI0026DEE3BE|nr:sodium-dependent transporter [Sutterella sp.]MDO5532288.1 sodium-dependent transporter [Sutterella sp.]